MAKAIEPTPMLTGRDAANFLRLTAAAELRPDKKRADFLKECFLLFSSRRF